MSSRLELLRSLRPIMDEVRHQTVLGSWSGIDGLKNILKENHVLRYIKSQDPELYETALYLILNNIIKQSEKSMNLAVLIGFIHAFAPETLDFVVMRHEKINKYPLSQKTCYRELRRCLGGQ